MRCEFDRIDSHVSMREESDTGKLIGNMAFVTDMSVQKKALSVAGEV